LGGLTGTSRRAVRAAGITAVAGLAAFGLAGIGCSAGGAGLQDDGPVARAEVAGTETGPSDSAGGTEGGARPTQDGRNPSGAPTPTGPAGASATPSAPAPEAGVPERLYKVDPVQLLSEDPEVDKRVKRALQPCADGGGIPVDIAYGSITGASAPDVVVNVMNCSDSVGVAAYVYRPDDKLRYASVFRVEEAAVIAEIDRGDLVVSKQVFAGGAGDTGEPAGQEVTTYRWKDGNFTRLYWMRNEYLRTLADETGGFEPSEAAVDPSGASAGAADTRKD
jgi:hypothetical protein